MLVVDAAANLAAVSSLALAVALGVSLIVAVEIVSGENMSRRQRWALAGAWGASTLATVATAAPAGQWVMPITAVLVLPAFILVGRIVRRGLREWVFGAQPASHDRRSDDVTAGTDATTIRGRRTHGPVAHTH